MTQAPDTERVNSIVEALAASSLDAFITATPSTVLLLTGCWPVVGNTVAVAARSGDTVLLVPEDELEIAHATSFARLIPYNPGALDRLTEAAAELRAPLAALFSKLKLGGGAIGVELAHTLEPATYVSTAQFRDTVVDILNEIAPNATIAASDGIVSRLRARKTRMELERISVACSIAASAYSRACSAIRPRATEREVASAFQSAFDTAPLPDSVQRSHGAFFCMSGPNSASASAAYARTRNRIIEAGDLVMIHANTCADGYWTDITRTYTAGQPSERHTQMSAAIMEARQASLAAVRPGVPASEVDRAAREVMQTHGFGEAFRHGTGHGVGFAAISASALPRIHPASPDILEEGMTFNIEPAAYFDGYGGMRHCDVVAVTPTGVRVLTDF